MTDKGFYAVTLNGNEYYLPIVSVSDELSIAVFDMLNNPRMTMDTAIQLGNDIDDQLGWDKIDTIITPECKCISLAYELAKTYDKELVVLRKSDKLYNPEAYSIELKSITTDHVQKLYLGKDSAGKLVGQRVLILDDVISTGGSLRAILELLSPIEGLIIVGSAFAFAEGETYLEFDNVVTLGELPLIR